MRTAASLWLAAMLPLFLYGELRAQPRVRLPGTDAQDAPLSRQIFDPYGDSGSADIPKTRTGCC